MPSPPHKAAKLCLEAFEEFFPPYETAILFFALRIQLWDLWSLDLVWSVTEILGTCTELVFLTA